MKHKFGLNESEAQRVIDVMSLNNNFSNNLKQLRKSEKLSQKELAGILRLTRNQIASYEQGIAEPTLCNLVKIAKYFGVSLNTLVI